MRCPIVNMILQASNPIATRRGQWYCRSSWSPLATPTTAGRDHTETISGLRNSDTSGSLGSRRILNPIHELKVNRIAAAPTRSSDPIVGKRITKCGPGRPVGPIAKKRRKMSAAARAKISAAQKARWAKVRASGKKK